MHNTLIISKCLIQHIVHWIQIVECLITNNKKKRKKKQKVNSIRENFSIILNLSFYNLLTNNNGDASLNRTANEKERNI